MKNNALRRSLVIVNMLLGITVPAAEKPVDADNFYRSSQATAREVCFKNQYQMKIAGKLIIPKQRQEELKLPAIIVGHPMGAVKEIPSFSA